MSILNELGNKNSWQDFFAYKKEKTRLLKRDEEYFRDFIEKELYKPVTDFIFNDDYCFSVPEKKLINKHGKSKKRVVYTFSEQENMVLKLMTFLLYRYDDSQPVNCYSFRRNYGVKKAIKTILREKNIEKKYSCKLDISDYFNSINVELLLPILNELLSGDAPLFRFLERLLTADKALFNGGIITEKRGAMAGIPVSQFFSNIYLAEMDRFFLNEGILYARYSDDIIFFADSREMLDKYLGIVLNFISEYRLTVNPEKVRITEPGERWDYLGISFDNGKIGLSPATMRKIKGKIRRKARTIYRWKIRKEAGDSRAMRAFSRSLHRKFFGKNSKDEFTWARWFFPLINTDNDLRTIDAHVQEYMRYIKTGRFNKANYRITYSDLKDCGYISLVNRYYSGKAKNGKNGVLLK